MRDVSDLYLQKRGGTWYFYRRVPPPLVSIIGKGFIKKSLGTADKGEAKILRSAFDVEVNAKFAAAKAQLAQDPTALRISVEMLTEQVRGWVAETDKRYADRLLRDPPASTEELKDRIDNTDEALCIFLNPDDPRRDEEVALSTDRLLARVGGTPADQEVVAAIAEIVRRAEIEVYRRRLDRYADRHDRSFHDSLFDPARPSTVTFDELATGFLAERKMHYELNRIGTQRSEKVAAVVDYLREVIGNSTPVHSIDDDTVQKVRTTLARTLL